MAGAAWLGLGLILADDNPAAILGLLAALLALAGGLAERGSARPVVLRALACLVPVLLARWAAGSLAAALAAGCVAAGWWLRVRPSDLILVLALLGGTVAAISSASAHLVLAFVVLGVLTVTIGPTLAGARRYLRLIVARRNKGEGPCGNQALEVNR
jgi:hypothetical protein